MKKQKTYSGKTTATRRRNFFHFLTAFVLLNVAGCVYDNWNDCSQGINVRFFSKSPCDIAETYPEFTQVRMFVFDMDGNVVMSRYANENEITEHHTGNLPIGNGLYTVAVWGGINSEGIPGLIDSEGATKEDIFIRIPETTPMLDGVRIYYGESRPVFLPDPTEYGSIFEQVDVNVQEVTNRITVQVEGLSRRNDNDFAVAIQSEIGAMNMSGTVERGGNPRTEYAPTLHEWEYDRSLGFDVLNASFTTLPLVSGYNTVLVINDMVSGAELYRGDLLGTLLLKNPTVNLACDRDFTIRFTAADQCDCGIYAITEIWVNNWLVHSYGTDL
jgi:hypothetical protein